MSVKPENVLLPIDLSAVAPEVFTFVNQMPAGQRFMVTLLHVVTLNVRVPENRLYTETARDAEASLEMLAERFLGRHVERHICVRAGKAAGEIVAGALQEKSDLIVLTSRERAPRRFRLFAVPVLETVLKSAPCPVSVLRVRNRIDCWLRPAPATVNPSMNVAPVPFSSWPALPDPARRSATGH